MTAQSRFKPNKMRPTRKTTLKLSTLFLALSAIMPSAHADEASLLARINQLDKELQSMRAEVAQLKQAQASKTVAATPSKNDEVNLINGANTVQASSTSTDQVANPNDRQAAVPNAFATYGQNPTAVGASTFFGYGELNYGRPKNGVDAQADVSRVVAGVQHRFSDKTKFVAEFEIEHAVASSSDKGEVALEQAYIEHQLSDRISAQAGLFLMPMGMLNENHEPTAYYGVNRNFVETAIIPSTWREGGLKVIGQLDRGVTLQGGISTSFNLNKWDATSTEGLESPLGSIHQEMSKAKSKDLGFFAAADWRGVPGLRVGASAFGGNISQGNAAMPSSRLLLWDVHAKWEIQNLELSALYSQGTISNTSAWNTPLVGNSTLIPAKFYGGYLQAAYKIWQNSDYSLAAFARTEWLNTASQYASLGAGLTPAAAETERVITLGTSFGIGKNVVLKTDYQWFKTNNALNRFNLGLGWAF